MIRTMTKIRMIRMMRKEVETGTMMMRMRIRKKVPEKAVIRMRKRKSMKMIPTLAINNYPPLKHPSNNLQPSSSLPPLSAKYPLSHLQLITSSVLSILHPVQGSTEDHIRQIMQFNKQPINLDFKKSKSLNFQHSREWL